MKKILLLLTVLIPLFVSCSSDEPEPTYNWWVLITCDKYKVGKDMNDLTWIEETRHDERYEIDKTETYIKEQQAKYDGKRGSVIDGYVHIFSYRYKKIDNIPIK